MVDGLEHALDPGAALDGCALEFGILCGQLVGLVDGALHALDVAGMGGALLVELLCMVLVRGGAVAGKEPAPGAQRQEENQGEDFFSDTHLLSPPEALPVFRLAARGQSGDADQGVFPHAGARV